MNNFLAKFGLKSIIRAHQVKKKGYDLHDWNGPTEFPPVITIFSAPNYGGHGNDGAVMICEKDS